MKRLTPMATGENSETLLATEDAKGTERQQKNFM
jgi:hypothetical protein